MRGWATPRTQDELALQRAAPVFAFVVDKSFPDGAFVEDAARRALAAEPEAIFVIRATDTHAAECLARVGVSPVLAGLNPHWKVQGELDGEKIVNDQRRLWRDNEILNYCSKIVVFKDANSSASAWWTDKLKASHGPATWGKRLFIVERGSKKKRARKGRKPAGV